MTSIGRSRVQWLLIIATVALLVAPLPIDAVTARWPSLSREIKDLAHPVVFGWLAHLAYVPLRRRWPAPSLNPTLLVLTGAVFFGLATEAAQRLTGRDSAWMDLLYDVVGATITLLLHARAESRRDKPRQALVVAATALALLVLAPFAWTVAAYAHRVARMPILWQEDEWLFTRFAHRREGRYQALVLEEPTSDWRDWRYLEVDVESTGEEVNVVVRVHDRLHDRRRNEDRYNEAFLLPPRSRQTLRIPLERIRTSPDSRVQDMSAIRGLIIYASNQSVPRAFVVHKIQLAE